MSAQPADLRSLIRDIPDFPRPGIGFKDITPLMADADALAAGVRLLATGGTAAALCTLVEQLGGVVAGCGFLIELAYLNGRERLAPHDVHSLLTFES